MEDQIIKGMGSTTTGALLVTLLWFLRTIYKKYAGRVTIRVIKLINGNYAAKVRRGIGFERWVRKDGKERPWVGNSNLNHGVIWQCVTDENIIDVARNALSIYGVSRADRVDITRTGFTEEKPEL